MPCPWPRTALFFDLLKIGQGHNLFFLSLKFHKKFAIFCAKTFFFWRTPEILQKMCNYFARRPFFFVKHLRVLSLVLGLGLEHSCPWPREGLSSESQSLASDLFCVIGLGLEPRVLDSTSDYYVLCSRLWNNFWIGWKETSLQQCFIEEKYCNFACINLCFTRTNLFAQ